METVMKYLIIFLGMLAFGLTPATSHAEEVAKFANLDGDVQALKKELMSLNRDLFILEEELLFPANTQMSVYVSMDVGEYFELDSVELKLNGKKVSSYLYTEREAEALLRGGVQRLYVGNMKAGNHELVAVFTGIGPNDREYRRGATLEFEKTLSAKFVELKIEDQTRNMQPEFAVREWD